MNDIHQVSIKNYRAIDEISFTPGRITILVGPNNSGKSSVLEAIALLKSCETRCEDALGVYVAGELIRKYSMDYLFQNLEKPVLISDGDMCITLRYYSEGYPKDAGGSHIQDYFSDIIQDHFNQPDTINRIRSRFLQERRYADTPQRRHTGRRDGATPSEIQPLSDRDERDERFRMYITGLEKKIGSVLYQTRKIVVSGLLKGSPALLYVILDKENMGDIQQQEEVFDFMRYQMKSFHEIQSPVHTSTGFVSDYDTGFLSGRLEDLHDDLVRRNLIGASHNRIISRVPYIEDIRKTDEGLYVSISGKDRTIPLASMGDGFKSMLKIIYLSVLARNGVITLEEPELSLHPGYIGMLADTILFCSKETQFFISTHSNDLIESLLEVAGQNSCLDLIRIIKMHPRLDAHTIEIEEIPGAEALDDIETIRIDLRGI